MLEDTGRLAELKDEAAQLSSELRSGHWRLTKAQYQFYSAEARRWLGHTAPEMDTPDLTSEAVALADAVQWLWGERPWEGPSAEPTARQLVQMDDIPVLTVWNTSGGVSGSG